MGFHSTSWFPKRSPAPLLVAKVHKIAERAGTADRVSGKDALDVLRLLRATDTATLADGLVQLSTHDLSAAVTTEAIDQRPLLFGTPEAAGIAMAARAARPNAEADVISASFVALVSDLLSACAS